MRSFEDKLMNCMGVAILLMAACMPPLLVVALLSMSGCGAFPTRDTATGAATALEETPGFLGSMEAVRVAARKACETFFSSPTIIETVDTLVATAGAQKATFKFTQDEASFGRSVVRVAVAYDSPTKAKEGVKELLHLLDHHMGD